MSEGNGKRFIDLLIAASPLERGKVRILDRDVFFAPVTRKAIADAMPKDNVQREPDYVGLFLLVAFAEDEAGAKLFRVSDIDALRERVSAKLLAEIEQAMMRGITPSPKEADKIIAADPPSASA